MTPSIYIGTYPHGHDALFLAPGTPLTIPVYVGVADGPIALQVASLPGGCSCAFSPSTLPRFGGVSFLSVTAASTVAFPGFSFIVQALVNGAVVATCQSDTVAPAPFSDPVVSAVPGDAVLVPYTLSIALPSYPQRSDRIVITATTSNNVPVISRMTICFTDPSPVNSAVQQGSVEPIVIEAGQHSGSGRFNGCVGTHMLTPVASFPLDVFTSIAIDPPPLTIIINPGN